MKDSQDRLADVPIGIALVAEAAWIAAFAGLLQAFALRDPVTGIPVLLVAAIAGTAAARTLPDRTRDAWPVVAVVLAFLAGLAGFLAAAEVLALLLEGGPGALGPALAANPGGWLAALAFVRGMAYARRPVDANRVTGMLVAAVPALALAATVGGMISEPSRSRFLAAAQVDVLVFLAAAVLALALGRLANVGRGARVDWRHNPGWLALAGTLVLATAAMATWAAVTIGNPIAVAVSVLAAPLLAVGFIAALDRRSLRFLAICVAIATAIGALGRLIASRRTTSSTTPGDVAPPVLPGPEDAYAATAAWVLVLVLVLAVGAVLVLARLWVRRKPDSTATEDEVRTIDRDEGSGPGRPSGRWPRFGRRGRPADAVAAYRALLAALDGRRPVAREPGETPVEHARRLRDTGHGTLGLELLAADYGLARFAGVALTDAETRRAIGRADRVRAALLRVPVEAPEDAEVLAGRGATARRRPGEGPAGTRGSRRGGGPGADLPDADAPGETDSVLNRIRRGP